MTILPAFAVADDVRRGTLRTLTVTDMSPHVARTAILTQRSRKMSIAATSFVEHLVAMLRKVDDAKA